MARECRPSSQVDIWRWRKDGGRCLQSPQNPHPKSHWSSWSLSLSSADSETPSLGLRKKNLIPIHSSYIICQVSLWARMLLVQKNWDLNQEPWESRECWEISDPMEGELCLTWTNVRSNTSSVSTPYTQTLMSCNAWGTALRSGALGGEHAFGTIWSQVTAQEASKLGPGTALLSIHSVCSSCIVSSWGLHLLCEDTAATLHGCVCWERSWWVGLEAVSFISGEFNPWDSSFFDVILREMTSEPAPPLTWGEGQKEVGTGGPVLNRGWAPRHVRDETPGCRDHTESPSWPVHSLKDGSTQGGLWWHFPLLSKEPGWEAALVLRAPVIPEAPGALRWQQTEWVATLKLFLKSHSVFFFQLQENEHR